jgi:hypothetical protein
MLFTDRKPKVYIETTVVSYLAARLSRNATIAARQQATRQFWHEHAYRFDFITSDAVLDEIEEGDKTLAQRRIHLLRPLTVFETTPTASQLTQALLDSGAVPQSSQTDAKHIAIAAVYNIEYLATWNYKHIVNVHKRQHIEQVCRNSGFQPAIICTPAVLIEVNL